MARVYKEVRRNDVVDNDDVVVDDRATTDDVDTVDTAATLGQRIVSLVGSLIMALLALRFILSLLGANRSNGFADFIYRVSQPFVAPFFGLFNYTPQYGVSRFEIETLVAIAVYAILTYLLSRLFAVGRNPNYR